MCVCVCVPAVVCPLRLQLWLCTPSGPVWKPVWENTCHLFCPLFTSWLLSQLPEVLSSGPGIPESLQTLSGEDAAKWSQIREDLCSLKVSLRLRGKDGSVWNYRPQADSSGKEIFSLLPHMADMSTYMFKGIINFAKVISHFR